MFLPLLRALAAPKLFYVVRCTPCVGYRNGQQLAKELVCCSQQEACGTAYRPTAHKQLVGHHIALQPVSSLWATTPLCSP